MNWFRIFVFGTLALLTAGMIFLWIGKDNSEVTKQVNLNTNEAVKLDSEDNQDENETVVYDDESLKASISGLLSRVEKLEKNSNASVTTKVSSPTVPSFQKQVMYLGSASTTSRTWVDTNVEVTMNSSDYSASATVSFEAGLSIIGGIAGARLVNQTTGSIMSISEISHNGSTTTWKGSSSFGLHSGNNKYVVQLRSSSGETANMSGARLIISPN